MASALQSGSIRPAAAAGTARCGCRGAAVLFVLPVAPTPSPQRPALRHALQRPLAFLLANASGSPSNGPLQAVAASPLASLENELGWRSDFKRRFVNGKVLGQGSFGTVYLGVDLASGKEVAVKVLPKQRGKLSREKTLEKLAREMDTLERLQACAGVVQLEDVFEDAENVSIVTELCAGGDLQQYAETRTLDERALAHVALEVLRIVKACNDAGMMHGDVKPANFCLKHPLRHPLDGSQFDATQPWLKAIDFGCSQMLPVQRRLSKRTGTPVYMAPEVYEREYHKEADVWSMGVMLYQLYARRFPFWDTLESCKSAQLDEVAQAVATAPIQLNYGPWLGMSAEGRAFMWGCLQRGPAARLSVSEALEHPWLVRMGLNTSTSSSTLLPGGFPLHASQQQQHAARSRQLPPPLASAGPTPYPVRVRQHTPQQPRQPPPPQQQQQQGVKQRVGGRLRALVHAITSVHGSSSS